MPAIISVERNATARVDTGNVYLPASFATKTAREGLEWHGPEETHCWSATRNATITILINPEETRLSVDVSSASPKPYCCEMLLDEKHLGNVMFHAPGVQSVEFCIPSVSGGMACLKFRVPNLWRPVQPEIVAGGYPSSVIPMMVIL